MALTGDFLFFRLNGEIQTPLCEVFLELIPLVSSKVIVRNVSTRIINKISEKCFLLINGTCEFYSLHYFLVPAAIFASLAGKYLCKPLFLFFFVHFLKAYGFKSLLVSFSFFFWLSGFNILLEFFCPFWEVLLVNAFNYSFFFPTSTQQFTSLLRIFLMSIVGVAVLNNLCILALKWCSVQM